MKNIFKLAFVILVVIFTSCSDLTDAQKLEKYESHVKRGQRLVDDSRYNSAIAHSDSAINITDTLSTAFYVRGVANFGLGKYKVARDDFSEVIDIEGKKSIAYKNRALTFLKLDDSDFIDDIDQYLQYYPSDISARKFRISYYDQKKEYKKAIADYEILLLSDSNNLDLQKKLDDLKLKMGDDDNSLSQYAISNQSSHTDADSFRKKQEAESEIRHSGNTEEFIFLLVGSYFSYLLFVAVIIRPIVKKKAAKYIGGKFVIANDPLVWWLPIILSLVFLYFYFISQMPNIKLF